MNRFLPSDLHLASKKRRSGPTKTKRNVSKTSLKANDKLQLRVPSSGEADTYKNKKRNVNTFP